MESNLVGKALRMDQGEMLKCVNRVVFIWSYLMERLIFFQSVIIYDKFTVKMYLSTFRFECKIYQSQEHVRYFVFDGKNKRILTPYMLHLRHIRILNVHNNLTQSFRMSPEQK